MTNEIKSPLEMFYRWEKETPDQVFLRQPKSLVWTEYTWRDVANQVRRIGSFLNSKGYEKGSRIAIWSANSKDWPIADLAIQLSGHVSVPIYPGQDIESAHYILTHSETQLVFVGSLDQSQHFNQAIEPGTEVVGMLGCEVTCNETLEEIVGTYDPVQSSPIPEGEDLMTLIYTSGTTGNPKGVMHTYNNFGRVSPKRVKLCQLELPGNRLFSFLPMAHVAERTVVEMTAIYSNSSISFSESLATFGDEIRSVQPTMFFAVPRLWVKFKEGVDAKIPPAQQAFLTAEQKRDIARQLGLAEAKMIFSASAPLAQDVQDWFLDLSIILRDAYGASENLAHGTAWLKNDKPISGSVGQVMAPDVQVRISGDGEIQFKGDGMMTGYYLNPEKTEEAFDDGWYRTGDSGRFDEDGNLWITGRISEVFKTSKGKFIVPTRLENLFARCEQLAQFCVFGHGKTQAMILVTLSEGGMDADLDALKQELTGLLEEINAELPSYETVAKLYVTAPWTIENGLLTPTLKIKRRQIESTFKTRVEQDQSEEKVIFLR